MQDSPPDSLRDRYHVWHPRRASGRFIIALGSGLAASLAWPTSLELRLRGVIGWDIATIVLLGMVWPHISTANAEQTRIRAAADDPGRTSLFALAVASSLFSLFAGVSVIRHTRALNLTESTFWCALAIGAVGLAWTLTHTAFTLRYAHLFYRGHEKGGLTFPGTDEPCEMDFAYFAFTIGMCFQVSDVVVCDAQIRRTALAHALLSFVYNTTILALVLNLLFGFLSQ